jgi:hypothetical protein
MRVPVRFFSSFRWFRTLPWRSPRLLAGLVALGLVLRSYHYLRNPSVWHDEAALILNVLQLDFGDLLGHLLCDEAAPPLFLWVEKAVCLFLSDSPFALRLLPFLASCASLVLVAWIARRLLEPTGATSAVLLFACSGQLLWHACEAKPYSVDVLCSAGLIAAYLATEAWPMVRRLGLFTALAPMLIFLTYPGCFLYGGLLLALGPAIWRRQRAREWIAYAVLALTVAVSFALLALGPARAQRSELMEQCWVGQFPNWDRPWTVPPWAFTSTLKVFGYCCSPSGQLLAGVALVGCGILWRRGRRRLILLTVPILLALVAACLGAYPYGGARVLVYAAPAVVVLIGAGVPPAFRWLHGRSRLASLALTALLIAPVGLSAYRIVQPWQRADCASAAAFVLAHRQPTDPVTCNHWEYQYYFQCLGPALQPLVGVERKPGDRLWVVLTGAVPEHRQRIVEAIPPNDWQPLMRREFAGTSVFLLRRPGVDRVTR